MMHLQLSEEIFSFECLSVESEKSKNVHFPIFLID